MFLGFRAFNWKILPKSFNRLWNQKNKDQTNFYEFCDLTKKVYLMYLDRLAFPVICTVLLHTTYFDENFTSHWTIIRKVLMPYRPWIHRNTSSMLYRNKYEYIVYVLHSGPKCENYLLTEVVVVWIWQLPSIFLMMNIIFTYV